VRVRMRGRETEKVCMCVCVRVRMLTRSAPVDLPFFVADQVAQAIAVVVAVPNACRKDYCQCLANDGNHERSGKGD
jgi:hypothetical protein